jgi:hypothetical protein
VKPYVKRHKNDATDAEAMGLSRPAAAHAVLTVPLLAGPRTCDTCDTASALTVMASRLRDDVHAGAVELTNIKAASTGEPFLIVNLNPCAGWVFI